MKFFILFSFLLFTSVFLFAQASTENIIINGRDLDNFIAKSIHKFPSFTKAHVHLKNGEVAVGRFNYDYFSDNFMYINEKNDTVALANPEDVDYVSFPVDSFFYDNKFYQWVASSEFATLAVRYTYKLARKDNLGAYGIAAPTEKVESHNTILGLGRYELEGNEQITFEKTTTYYIRKPNGKFVTAAIHNFDMVFPNKDLEGYMKKNKLNLKKQSDILDLFVYANQ
ncbi:MAG: hypothetical protein ABI784_08115 [Ginsengibacter sp.]